ncbi:Isoprenoid synthase domain containing protein [Elaphomyces granulatus]
MGNSILPFPDYPFVNSRELDRDALKRAGCFTTFRARINIRDDLANTGMIRADKDWATAKNQQWHGNTVGCTFSPVGTAASFMYLECLPDRMEVISYLNELGFLHDDDTETLDSELALNAHKQLRSALICEKDSEEKSPIPVAIMKKLFSAVVLDCLEIDLAAGRDVMRCYTDDWLKVLHTSSIPFTTLDEYFKYRFGNAGISTFWRMTAFGHGTPLSDEDFNLMSPLLDIAARIYLLTNDLYSWPTEKYQNKDHILNAVFLYIKTQTMSEEEAITKVKQEVLDHEARFFLICESFCEAHPDFPARLKKFVNVLEPSIGGYHYWCSTCPRHNSPKQNIPLPKAMRPLQLIL